MVEQWDSMVQQVATETRRRFHMVERQDIVQELWLWLLEHEERVTEWSEQGQAGERKLATSLRRQARAYATVEKAARVGYEVEDLYYYSTGQIRTMLPDVFNREAWAEGGQPQVTGKIARTSRPDEGNNRLAALVEVRKGLESLPAQDKELLLTAFGMGVDSREHSLSLEITEEALKTRIKRAIQRLQKALGGPRPDLSVTGRRRALSNAQAIAMTRTQEGEE